MATESPALSAAVQRPLACLRVVSGSSWSDAMDRWWIEVQSLFWTGLWWYLIVCIVVGLAAWAWTVAGGDSD